MAKPRYHNDFVTFLRTYPTNWDFHRNMEMDRLNKNLAASPDVAAQFEKNTPDPRQRLAILSRLADRNTDQMMQTELHKEALRFGVKDVSPQMVREAFTENMMTNSPVNDNVRTMAKSMGRDADQEWETKQVPDQVAKDFARVQPHMFPAPEDPAMPPLVQPQHTQPRPVVQQTPAAVNVGQGSSFNGDEGAPTPSAPSGPDTVANNQTGGGAYAPGTEAP